MFKWDYIPLKITHNNDDNTTEKKQTKLIIYKKLDKLHKQFFNNIQKLHIESVKIKKITFNNHGETSDLFINDKLVLKSKERRDGSNNKETKDQNIEKSNENLTNSNKIRILNNKKYLKDSNTIYPDILNTNQNVVNSTNVATNKENGDLFTIKPGVLRKMILNERADLFLGKPVMTDFNISSIAKYDKNEIDCNTKSSINELKYRVNTIATYAKENSSKERKERREYKFSKLNRDSKAIKFNIIDTEIYLKGNQIERYLTKQRKMLNNLIQNSTQGNLFYYNIQSKYLTQLTLTNLAKKIRLKETY